MTLAEILAKRLAEEEVGVGAIAQRLRVHQSMLRKWLSGTRHPGAKCRVRLSHFLRLPEAQISAIVAAEIAEKRRADDDK